MSTWKDNENQELLAVTSIRSPYICDVPPPACSTQMPPPPPPPPHLNAVDIFPLLWMHLSRGASCCVLHIWKTPLEKVSENGFSAKVDANLLTYYKENHSRRVRSCKTSSCSVRKTNGSIFPLNTVRVWSATGRRVCLKSLIKTISAQSHCVRDQFKQRTKSFKGTHLIVPAIVWVSGRRMCGWLFPH